MPDGKIGPLKNWSPGLILAKKLVPQTNFGCQKWSPLAKNGPPKGDQNGQTAHACTLIMLRCTYDAKL